MMKTIKKQHPLLKTGTFGTHIIKNPANTYSFAGNVPERFRREIFKSEEEGIKCFAEWFAKWPEIDRKKHITNLRNDVFVLVLQAIERNNQKMVIQPWEIK